MREKGERGREEWEGEGKGRRRKGEGEGVITRGPYKPGLANGIFKEVPIMT